MATADGLVEPAVPSLDNVVCPGRGGVDVPHGRREIPVEPRGVVIHHQSLVEWLRGKTGVDNTSSQKTRAERKQMIK